MPRNRETVLGSFDLGDSLTFEKTQPGQSVSVGAASAASAVMGDGVRCARVYSTVDCWIEVGPTPVAAATTSIPLPANYVDYVRLGPNDKIAVIQMSAGGTLYITPGR